MDLRQAVCIVTGAATGVGAACAKALAARGARVVVNYRRNREEAEATAARCAAAGGEALVVQGDVSVDADCRRLAEAAQARWGRIDGLVNNAGVTTFAAHADLEALSAEDFQRIYAVNLIGAFQMTRAAAPALTAGGDGAIVNISSIAGVKGLGSSIAYAASKGALNTLTLSLARVLGPAVRVNAVCPGFIEGRWLREGYGEAGYAALKSRYEEGTPLRRTATAAQVAEVVLWLLSGAELVTGELIMVDSGMHLGRR